MKKREANFQTTFSSYVQKKKIIGNFELKQTTGNSFPFKNSKSGQDRQINSLVTAQQEGYFWKFSDEDSREKLFDCSNVPPIDGYIVIKYPKVFCIINIYDFIAEDKRSERRSLTKERAMEISIVNVEL